MALVLGGIVAAIVLSMGGSPVAGPSPTAHALSLGSPPAGAGGAYRTDLAACPNVFPASDVNASVAEVYATLANLSRNGSAGGNGSAGNASAASPPSYPTEAAALTLVAGWWQSVCTSSAFTQTYAAWGTSSNASWPATNFSWSTSVGPSRASWGFELLWITGCTSPSNGSFVRDCGYDLAWVGDLSTGSLAGPTETFAPPCAGTCIAPYPTAPGTWGPTSIPAHAHPSTGPFGPYGWLLAVIATAALLAFAFISYRRRLPGREPPRTEADGSSSPEDELEEAEPLRDVI